MDAFIKGWRNKWQSCWNHTNPYSSKVSFNCLLVAFPNGYLVLLLEPLLPTQPEEIADLAKMTSCPIALGERLYTRHDYRPYLERRAIDIAQPDVSLFTNYYPSILTYRIIYRLHTVEELVNCAGSRP